MKTNVFTCDNMWVIKTEDMTTSFKDCDGAATQIGFLQQENLSLRADIEALHDELEDCEGYDEEFDDFESRSGTITEENHDRDWDSYDQDYDNKRED